MKAAKSWPEARKATLTRAMRAEVAGDSIEDVLQAIADQGHLLAFRADSEIAGADRELVWRTAFRVRDLAELALEMTFAARKADAK